MLKHESIVLYSHEYEREALSISNRLSLPFDGTVKFCEISSEFIPYAENNTLIYDNGKMGEFNTIVIIFPLFYENSEEIYRRLSSIERLNGLVLMVSVPDKRLISKPIYTKLQDIYMKSSTIDKTSLLAKANRYLEILAENTSFTFIDHSGSKLHFLRESPIWTDVLNDNKQGVFQIPGGEVFFAIRNYSANGEIYIGNKKYMVVNNVLSRDDPHDDNAGLVICEFGLGVNEFVPRCLSLEIAEKSYGTCHFGFGNNCTFGGMIDEGYHFDVTYGSFSLYSGDKLLIKFE
ncbi:MAG: hypothetical protein KIC94_15405 [Clostridiales bacterium]|nr:hypothetical protein [Clostridiales bacterium]